MDRRTFLKTSAAAGIAATIAGCTGSGSPPPRESEVVEQVQVNGGAIAMNIESDPVIESRLDIDKKSKKKKSLSPQGLSPADLSPIGLAAAKGRGTGKGGRGISGATGRHGRAKWRGGSGGFLGNDVDADEYQAAIIAVGIAQIGAANVSESRLPGPGPVPWEKKWVVEGSPADEQTAAESDTEVVQVDRLHGDTVNYDFQTTGWFRVGTRLFSREENHDFGWESVDFEVVENDSGGYEVKNQWKVSPQL